MGAGSPPYGRGVGWALFFETNWNELQLIISQIKTNKKQPPSNPPKGGKAYGHGVLPLGRGRGGFFKFQLVLICELN